MFGAFVFTVLKDYLISSQRVSYIRDSPYSTTSRTVYQILMGGHYLAYRDEKNTLITYRKSQYETPSSDELCALVSTLSMFLLKDLNKPSDIRANDELVTLATLGYSTYCYNPLNG